MSEKRSALLAEFPPVPMAEWEEAIRQDLKGQDYEAKLLWRPDEPVTIKPYYRAEDLADVGAMEAPPGSFPFLRGTRPTNDWAIQEVIEESEPSAANEAARAAIAAGAEGVTFAGAEAFDEPCRLAALLYGLPLTSLSIQFDAGERAAAVLEALIEIVGGQAALRDLRGSLDYAPAGDWGRTADLVRRARAALSRFRPITIRGARFQDAGSTVVQELGYTLSEGIETLAQLTDRNVPVADAAAALLFTFAAGSNYFFEIAKFRAARLLWARIVESFDPGAREAAVMALAARTSHWNKTIYDPYVNVLRATTEAMSAALGGCDSITVLPFDAVYRPPNEFSRRLARNTQLILKKEALLNRVADPAGGSYYLEVLTHSIARESWKLVQHVEALGGFAQAWGSGEIQADIERSRRAKETAVAERRRTILGTNEHPAPGETMLAQVERIDSASRAARQFEEIRLRTERHAARTGGAPRFLMLEMGDPIMRRARSGFAAGFFRCAGFGVESETAASPEAAAVLAAERDADAVVLCSSDAEYSQIAPAVITALRKAGRITPVLVAGKPAAVLDELRRAGVADFIHAGTNAVDVLRAWQQRLGVGD